MLTLIIILVAYFGLHAALFKIFNQHGYAAWKAFVPFYSEYIWCKIVGRSGWSVFWLWVPIVGFFVGVNMIVDLLRSYNQNKFSQHLLGGAFPFIYLPYLFFTKELTYVGQGYVLFNEYQTQLRKAIKGKDMNALAQLAIQYPQFTKGIARQWSEAILFAVFAAHFIRLFFFEIYVIPTSSMEGSLLVGDYLFVSKAHYGIRLPMTPLSFPLLHNVLPINGAESYSKLFTWDYRRLPAISEVKRFDPVVFNYPEGDSVFGYNVPYEYEYMNLLKTGENTELQSMLRKYKVQVRPVDKRDHYIKRCVGVAGDSIEVREGILLVNGQPLPDFSGVQYLYQIHKKVTFDTKTLENQLPIQFERRGKQVLDGYAYMSPATAEKVRTLQGVDSLNRLILNKGEGNRGSKIFPYNRVLYPWNIDNFGPLWIPKKGATVPISMSNIDLYARIIGVFEGNKLELKEGLVYINGKAADSYTFQMDYYWMMGDNRNQSADSRSWGFVPADHIVGKPLLVLISFRNAAVGDGVRWERVFKSASCAE